VNETAALDAFAALSQGTRLQIIRRLVQAEPEGLSAGALADAVEASSSNASFHLAHLERAGLIRSQRLARSIIYRVEIGQLQALIRFLMEDCCRGHPELGAAALDGLVASCSGERLPMTDSPHRRRTARRV
jgi:ArsR family transcriptional regulator, arsenate/arsenite/antimonite-responsive transcriptional repressor